MSFEKLIQNDVVLAEVLWSSTKADSTTFFSSDEAPLQLGQMSHKSGFVEPAHYHPVLARKSCSTQQAFVVMRGKISVDFFNSDGSLIRTFDLEFGDAILISEGIHRIRVQEDSLCVTIKQGPFLGPDIDKIEVTF